MNNPVIADNKPKKVELTSGETYYFCACGRSKNQPFCDGSHAGTDFKPQSFVAESSETAYLCQCKHSNNQPFCDGTHKQFSQEQVGKEGPGIAVKTEGAPQAQVTKEEPTVTFIHELA